MNITSYKRTEMQLKPDPIFQDSGDGLWYFYDESFTHALGGYPTREQAVDCMEDYCKYIDGCGYN